MSSRKPPVLSYASPDLSWPARLEFLQKFFWPIATGLFLIIVFGIAHEVWAEALLQLLTSGLLLLAWLAAGHGFGSFLFPRREEKRSALINVTAVAAGLGGMSLLVMGLALLGWLNQPVAILLIALGDAAFLWPLIRRRAQVPFRLRALWLRMPGVHFAWLAIVPLAAVTFTAAMLPAGFLWGAEEPNAYDVLEYHLQVPREWFEAGRMLPLTHNVFSFMPFNVEMHYLFAMHLMGGPWVAQFLCQMMHLAFIGLTVAAVYAAVEERGKFIAICAGLLVASTPWMPMLGSIAYNEGGLLLFGTLAIAWAMRCLPAGHVLKPVRFYALAGAMAGLACGCKLTGVPLLLIGIPLASGGTLVLWGILFVRLPLGKWFARHLVFVGMGLLVFSPWLIRNYAWVGNPVFPEQQKLLGRGYFSPEQSDRFYKAHKPTANQQAMSARVEELGHQVFADRRFGYALLPIGILGLLVTLRRPESQFLMIVLIGLTAFWLLLTHLQGRFYALAIPIAAMAMAGFMGRRLVVPLAICTMLLVFSGTGFVVMRLNQQSHRNGVNLMQAIGYTEFDQASGYEKEAPADDTPVVLVGDATAFAFHTPMKRLRYRTVFDVDTSKGRSIFEAWTKGEPADESVFLWINVVELDRFSKTYGIPSLAPSPLYQELQSQRELNGYGKKYVVESKQAKRIPFTPPAPATSPASPRSPSPPAPASAPSP